MRSEACNVITKETLALVLPCEFCEIFKGTFSYRTPPMAASVAILHDSCNGIRCISGPTTFSKIVLALFCNLFSIKLNVKLSGIQPFLFSTTLTFQLFFTCDKYA